ncbi:MAG TPA: EthD domain-containing protein [Acidimicrobiia bacterium]
MTVIAAVRRGPLPRSADALYVPIGEGVSGRDDEVVAIAVWHTDVVPELRDLAAVEAYRADERVQWDRGGATVARVSFVRRAPGSSREEFARHWSEEHAPLARRHHPGICRYVQHVVADALTPGAPEVDGIAELGFASLADFRERMYDSPEGQQVIATDVRRFLDVGAGWRMLARPLS